MTTDPHEPLPYHYRLGEPPRGHLVLEASAGTGKTWTVEHMVVDYLALGVTEPSRIVVVTYTRAAAAELSSRVRATLNAAFNGTGEYADHAAYDDKVVKARLLRALADFHELRISTIHGFAQRSLTSLGEPVGRVTPDVSDKAFYSSLAADAIRALSGNEMTALATWSNYRNVINDALKVLASNPSAHFACVCPADEDAPPRLSRLNDEHSCATSSPSATDPLTPLEVARCVLNTAKSQAELRKRYLGLVGYEDLLSRFRNVLNDADVAERFASGIDVLIVDEFQDTDALQWSIFSSIMEHGDLHAVVVVGDPKQAIYGFRGGDVAIYREATAQLAEGDPTVVRTLVSNRRSTTDFINAENVVFEHRFSDDVGFGFDASTVEPTPTGLTTLPVSYVPVTAEGANKDAVFEPAWLLRGVAKSGAGVVRSFVARDVVSYVKELVSSGQLIPADDGAPEHPVGYGDICVLVESNAYGSTIVSALREARIPATIIGGANVMASEAAVQWSYLFRALRNPAELEGVALYSLSWFGNESKADVVHEARREYSPLVARAQNVLVNWLTLFVSGRRDDFFHAVTRESSVLTVLASLSHGARHLTDFLHVMELLRARTNDDLDDFITLLEESSRKSDGETSGDDVDDVSSEWARRTEGDDQAVRVMTIHQSKGLEFPVVLVPFLSVKSGNSDRVVAFRARVDDENVTLLAFKKDDNVVGAIQQELSQAEKRRKLYVAMTRGKFHTATWLWDSETYAAAEQTKRRNNGVPEPDVAVNRTNAPVLFSRDEAEQFVSSRTEASGRSLRYELTSEPDDSPVDELVGLEPTRPASATYEVLAPSSRLSFSGLQSRVQGATALVDVRGDYEPEDGEPSADRDDREDDDDDLDFASSAQVGRVMHRALQFVDFSAPDFDGALVNELTRAARTEGVAVSDATNGFSPTKSAIVLARASRASLGAAADGQTLQELCQRAMLPEMSFDFHLRGSFALRDVLDVIRATCAGEPGFSAWVDALREDDVVLRGAMTGSLDAVLAWGDGDEASFMVVDYKTNKSPSGRYDQPSLEVMMNAKSYQLQALLYTVALHRYLTARWPQYSYERHVRGALYLFVRGMDASAPGDGVVTLRPPLSCVEGLNRLFEGTVA